MNHIFSPLDLLLVQDCQPSSSKRKICSSKSGIVLDLDILDCHICMEPLSPQIFQCSNGHCVCQPCISKLKDKCPTCSEPIGKIRNLSLEKILESLKAPCEFAHMGCQEMLQYAKKKLHEHNCPQRPQQCPISQCRFNGQIKDFSLHFQESHHIKKLNFQYAQWFSTSIGMHEPYLLLHVEEDKLFLLHNTQEVFCNALYVTMLGSNQCGLQHNYCIAVKDGENMVQLKSNIGPSSSSTIKAMENSSIQLLLVPRSFMKSRRLSMVGILYDGPTGLMMEMYIGRPGQSVPSYR